MRISLLLLIMSIFLAINDVKAQEDTLNNKLPVDSISPIELQEESFQNSIDELLEENPGMDLSGWDNKMINNGSFDPSKMTDTIRIMLYDSLKNLRFVDPFKNYITSGFGPRRRIYHYGVDIKLQVGDSVRAAFDGIVRVTKYDRRGYGNVVVVRHLNGIETIYGHLSKVMVETNQRVKAGEIIGLGGNTGRSTGSHLHFETRYHGAAFDPTYFFDFENSMVKCDTLILSRKNFEYLIELRKAKYCVIRKGDTLGRIAARFHTSIPKLCKLNRMSTKTLLRIGKKIRYQ
jgi:hypothetical protein